jgi:hypothetical protein
MKKIALFTVAGIFSLMAAHMSIGQVDEAACQKTISNNCMQCHNAKRICHELGESDANWPEIIKQMGEEGNLSQEVQDAALECLTKLADPKKLVCDK